MATGYLEQLVEERKWQEELTKVDVQFLYHIMNDAAVNMDFRYRAQTHLQWHELAEG
jgi:hypothetical protein